MILALLGLDALLEYNNVLSHFMGSIVIGKDKVMLSMGDYTFRTNS